MLENVTTAWRHCVRGELAACLEQLGTLPPLSTIDGYRWPAVERVLDSIVAVLPQRFAAACGLTSEASCLQLLEKLCDEGALADPDRNAALVATLAHGLRPPLRTDELPSEFVEYVRDYVRRVDDPDMTPVFHDVYVADSLASCMTALAPPRRAGLPGNLTMRMLCTTARARSGRYGDSDTGLWLERALDLASTDVPAAFKAPNSDPRALIHMQYVALDTLHHLGILDRDGATRLRAIEGMLALARQANQNSLSEEAWFLFSRVACHTGVFPPDADIRPADRIVEALLGLERCAYPNVAQLQDLLHVAAPFTDHVRVQTQAKRCWAVIRETYCTLAMSMPAASRWRAATSALYGMESLSLLSMLDEVRWTAPELWIQAMLPLFSAHPFPWRDTNATTTRADIRAVVAFGGTTAWVLQPQSVLDPGKFAGDLDQALWGAPAFRGVWSVNEDNIRTVVVFGAEQLASAGYFPVVRHFNDLTRRSGAPDVESIIHLASTKLRDVYEILRGHTGLDARQDDWVCGVGPLCQIPWELSHGEDARAAHVCLDPASEGLAAVAIPDVRVTEHTRVAIVGDNPDLAQAQAETDAITSFFESRTEYFATGDLASFQAAAHRCQVLHIAAHGTQAWQDPRGNTVNFADNALAACDLARLDLSHVDLVVINACDAAAPGPSVQAGEASIAGALIAAGAKAVIGALWSIEESCAAAFAVAFYGRFSTGMPLLQVFHEARRELRTHATALVGADSGFLSDAYRLLVRGRGIA